MSLNELSSDQVCVEIDGVTGAIVGTLFSTFAGDPNFLTNCAAAAVGPGNLAEPIGASRSTAGRAGDQRFGPAGFRYEEVGRCNHGDSFLEQHGGLGNLQHHGGRPPDPSALSGLPGDRSAGPGSGRPRLGDLSSDRVPTPPNPNELGYKDTVVALPGQITRIKAKFDIAGLYVWHCHIVEHEDNEMMRPLLVVPGPRIDFNNDGKTDILWRNTSTGANAVWYMDGVTLTGIADLSALPNPDYALVGAGDFNGDGKTDILWRNPVTGQNAVWYMNGVTLTGVADLPAFPNPAYAIAATGDFNGDGKTDILWRNASTGDNWVWYLDGVTLTDFGNLPALPNPACAGSGNRGFQRRWQNRHSLEKYHYGRQCRLVPEWGGAYRGC